MIGGGGTGGHLFPGIALAEEITTRQPGNRVVFVGTKRGIEATEVPKAGYELELIDVSALRGIGVWARIRTLFGLPRAVARCVSLLRGFRPDVVCGVGGYASGPLVLAAWLLRVPTVILEQNSIPGLTNRVLGKIASRVVIALAGAQRFFPRRKTLLLGNPIRQGLLKNFLRTTRDIDADFHVLVLGGSQGAHGLNLRMAEAASRLASHRASIRITHQTGAKDEALVKEAYASVGLRAQVVPFIDDMSTAYQGADVVVCRSGATTIAELTVAKKAAILVPYPYAVSDHQAKNGQELVQAGAALMMRESELDGFQLAQAIVELMQDPDRRRAMEEASGRLGRPEAAREIVDLCASLAEARKR